MPGYPDDLQAVQVLGLSDRSGVDSLLQWLPGVAGAETSVDQREP